MGFLDSIADSIFAARLRAAVARKLGIQESELPDVFKRGLDLMAGQNRRTGIPVDQLAQWFVDGVKADREGKV